MHATYRECMTRDKDGNTFFPNYAKNVIMPTSYLQYLCLRQMHSSRGIVCKRDLHNLRDLVEAPSF